MLKRTEGHCWLSRADAIASAPRALTSRLFHFSCQGYIVNPALNVLCLFDPQGCVQCHSLSKSRSLWLQRAPWVRADLDRLANYSVRLWDMKSNSMEEVYPKWMFITKIFFFFFLMDGIFFPSHLSVVGYTGTHTHKRARTHTYTRAHAYVNTHTTIFDGCVIFSYPSRIWVF